MSKRVELTFVVHVQVDARDEDMERGHWREGQRGDRAEDWIVETVKPLTQRQLAARIRQDLTAMTVDTGVSCVDYEFRVTSVNGGTLA